MHNAPPKYRFVSDEDRSRFLRDLARTIGKWVSDDHSPDAAIVVTPEGYGKSFLAVHLIACGFKVVFCAKSNAQLTSRERDITEKWPENPEFVKVLGRPVVVARYTSKIQNLQTALARHGVGPSEFKIVSYETDSPYSVAPVNEAACINDLNILFRSKGINDDGEEFFNEHYVNHSGGTLEGGSADVVLVSFAAFQAFCQSKKELWWEKLGLVASTESLTVERRGKQKHIDVQHPFEKVAVILDDPDRDDFDWLRKVSDENAASLAEHRGKITDRQLAMESPAYWKRDKPEIAVVKAGAEFARNEEIRNTPLHKIVKVKGVFYEERPKSAVLGYRFKEGQLRPEVVATSKGGTFTRRPRFCPKLIVTTTEMVTAEYARRTLEGVGLNAMSEINVFRNYESNVTAVSTTITRKRDQAALLPIVEQLKREFPEESVTLIADGLDCQFNLSTNKGRNDLDDCTTVIKLSWPHPAAIRTAMAHQEAALPSLQDSDTIDIESRYARAFNDMTPALMADLANQAIGRNQGFRYRGRQAILLIDPRWYETVEPLLRYKLNPWSDQLPSFNKKTNKKSALEALQMASEQSLLEKRLLELIHGFREFGLSEEAKQLVEKLPARQQKHFAKWLEAQNAPETLAKQEQSKAQRREKNRENVRRFRERKRAALVEGV